ncbi:MAG: hypothetical protein RSG57_02890, partial [Christensenellaceae bacterium]
RLIDMGLNQKQSVTLLYAISSLLGISAILFSMRLFAGALIILLISFSIGVVNWIVMKREHNHAENVAAEAVAELKKEVDKITDDKK